jgi:hypothetical protein
MHVTLSDAAEFALRTLDEDDRRRVTSWSDHLKNWENDEMLRSQARRLREEEDVYYLQTGTDLGIFFTLNGDQILIRDLARTETLQLFRRTAEHAQR